MPRYPAGANSGANYDRDSVSNVATALRDAGLSPRIMVDCSHGNSAKDHTLQPSVATDVAAQLAAGSSDIFGVMLESHLVEGRQDLVAVDELTYGQSVTDACISLETTEGILVELSEAVAQGEQRH